MSRNKTIPETNFVAELAAFQCYVANSFIKWLHIFLKSYGSIYIFAHRHLSERCLFPQGQTNDFRPRKLGQSAREHFVFLRKISLSTAVLPIPKNCDAATWYDQRMTAYNFAEYPHPPPPPPLLNLNKIFFHVVFHNIFSFGFTKRYFHIVLSKNCSIRTK